MLIDDVSDLLFNVLCVAVAFNLKSGGLARNALPPLIDAGSNVVESDNDTEGDNDNDVMSSIVPPVCDGIFVRFCKNDALPPP